MNYPYFQRYIFIHVKYVVPCLVSWGAVRLGSSDISATMWPTVPAPDNG
jgi:hypothetical protein